MMRMYLLPSLVAALFLNVNNAKADFVHGQLNSFDVINDTNVQAYGFEIELDGIHSTDITYTFDWQPYGTPKISEDNTDPAHPKVFVRYESKKNTSTGAFDTFTTVEGWEHFGFGHYGAPTAVKYHWLIENPSASGTLIHGPAVNLVTPAWTYTPAQPDVAQPAQVVAKIPAPPPQTTAPTKAFGDAVWVKAIKTTTHNNNILDLTNLVAEDPSHPEYINWKNGEPSVVEVEWKLLQDEFAIPNGISDYLSGDAEELAMGDETITRRYEFYKYTGPLDPTSNQAQCDQLPPINPTIDPTADPACFALGEAGLKGGYIGAQMAAFNAKAPLGVNMRFQYAEINQPYTPRSIIIGGNKPYTVNLMSSLPNGLTIDSNTGILAGTPTIAGYYMFNFDVMDTDGMQGNGLFQMFVFDPATPNSKYSLSVALIGNGNGQVVSDGNISCGLMPFCSEDIYSGSNVTLTATPLEGNQFTGWAGDACAGSTTTSCNVTMNAAKNVSAEFTLLQYSLSVGKSGTGSGTVSGNGIDCGATCSSTLDYGTSVSLTATPMIGSTFTGWSGACSGTGTCNVSIDNAKNVTATFALQQYALSVGKAGTGIVSGSGIDCGDTCSSTLDYGAAVTLNATPAADSIFSGWSGACTGTGTCSVAMDAAKNVTATFTLKTYALSVTTIGSGTITGGTIDCGTSCTAVMNAGSSITLTATPSSNNAFAGWSGDCAGSGNTCTVTMDTAKTVSASFVQIAHTLSVTKNNASYGSVTSSPAGINCGTVCSSQFNQGTSVVLTAKPVKSRRFTGWTGSCTGTSLTCTVSMTQSKSVTANFR